MADRMLQIETSNVSELNGLLTKMHLPFFEVSDLVKTNHLTMLKTSFTLTPNFPVKAINLGGSQKYYRMSIMSKFPVLIDE
jgi:hypothetical protein